jgi:hypothetical protein
MANSRFPNSIFDLGSMTGSAPSTHAGGILAQHGQVRRNGYLTSPPPEVLSETFLVGS